MKTRSSAIGIGFLFSLITTFSIAQNTTTIFGQLASSVATTKLPEIVQVRTHEPLVSFNLSHPHVAFTKTTLFNRNARISLASIASTESHRVLSAAITHGQMPEGTALKLNIEPPEKNYRGNPGNTAPEVVLSNIGRTIMSDIGTFISGKQADETYVLEYLCEIPAKASAYEALKGRAVTVTITIRSDI